MTKPKAATEIRLLFPQCETGPFRGPIWRIRVIGRESPGVKKQCRNLRVIGRESSGMKKQCRNRRDILQPVPTAYTLYAA